MNVRAYIATLCVAVLLAGCSVSSSTVIPSPSTSLRIDSIEVQAPRAMATLRVRITVPHPRPHAIDPHYMSRATKGISFAFSGASKYNAAFSLTPGSKGCSTSSGVTKCTFNLKLAAGKYKGTVSAYDMASVKGKIPAKANLLSTDANVPFTIASGAVNRAGFVFDGVVKSISLSAPSGTIGAPLSAVLSVLAKDADGNIIIGTYANSITLTDSDKSGATTVTASLIGSKDTVAFTYSGGAIASATIGANASGAVDGHATFAPSPVLTSIGRSSGLIGTSVSETLAGHFIAGSMHVNAGSGITVSDVLSTASSITATFFIDPEAARGARNVTVSTAAASSAPVTFTISNTGVDVVTRDTDSNPGTPAGTGTGTSGDLRYEMLNAAAGNTVVFDTTKMCGAAQCTIAIAGPLPPIAQNQTIDGGQFSDGTPRVIIDGANQTRAFWAKSGTVTIAHLQIQNALARGGDGGGGQHAVGGGGGAGLGAGLFVDAAMVTVADDYFLNNAAIGGNGGALTNGAGGGGGGGGMDGNGGGADGQGAGGGGGLMGAGADAGFVGGGNGGAGFSATAGGGGGASARNGSNGSPGAYGGGGGGGGDGIGLGCFDGTGAIGGFGGGGGGPAGGCFTAISGSAGGFGGGGSGINGTGSGSAAGGAGGPGGGGGAGLGSTAGSGGILAVSVGGGGGDTAGHGGGGAAAGPAIFVNTGTLTTTGSGASGSSATAGSGGTGGNSGQGSPGTADPTPVFNYGGTVNGVSVTTGHGGPVASALSSSQPQLQRLLRSASRRHTLHQHT